MSLLTLIHTLHGKQSGYIVPCSNVEILTTPGVQNAAGSSTESGLKHNLKIHLHFLDFQVVSEPKGSQFRYGKDLTAADVMMFFPLQVVQSSMGGLADYPGLAAYVERVCIAPAYKVSVKKAQKASGEEYALIPSRASSLSRFEIRNLLWSILHICAPALQYLECWRLRGPRSSQVRTELMRWSVYRLF